tara:strand:+ start:358 stop:468 length:111 start_codon:yes stop_codon:yes gene_type:complete
VFFSLLYTRGFKENEEEERRGRVPLRRLARETAVNG